jgi:hypothetical protein
LSFAFEDRDWLRKIMVGALFALLSVVLIGALYIGGYVIRVLRRSARGEATPLPEWDDFNELLGDGLRGAGIYLGYVVPLFGIPVLLIVCFALLGVLSGRAETASKAEELVFGLGMVAAYGLFFLASLALMIYLPAAFTRFALLDRFSAAFEVQENLAFMKRNASNYALALVVYLLANLIAQFGIFLCCVGLLPTTFWSTVVLGYALGEVARRDPAGLAR